MNRNNESKWDEDFNIDEIFCNESFAQDTDSRQSSRPASTSQSVLNISALCCDEEINGFDKLTGSTWIYPTNYPIRDYQFNILQAALFKNTLVSLPTGLGKTFIAAVLMYNFFRWYPLGKIVFAAPTRPLVAQQIDACYNIMAIPPDDTVEMTGSMAINTRKTSWKEKRVFFATPQVIDNDLRAGICPAESIRCLVFDEAHRARGKYAYCQIVTTLNDKKCRTYRLLALSATPGSKVEDVINVVKSLQIAHLELRTEECIDVARYSFSRKIETVVIPLGAELSNLRHQYVEILDTYTRQLRDLNVLSGNAGNLSKGRIVMLYKEFQAKDKSSRHPKHNQIMKDFLLLIALYHCLELLTKHGARVFLNFFDDHPEKSWITADDRLTILLERLREDLGINPLSLNTSTLPDGSVPEIPQDIKFGHPKFEYLRKIIIAHFKEASQEGRVTKAIVFCEYRESVNLVNCLLLQCRPLVKPQMFVGQGTGTVSANKERVKTVSQKQQLRIIKAFREGTCNTLVSTSVGEEGLDVGSVDLIVCFDISTRSPVRLVQRCGRTGRERGGKVFMLVTEGKEHQTLKECMLQRDNLNKRVMQCKELSQNLYKLNPRMLPQNVTPSCYKMFITVQKKEEKPDKLMKGQTDLRSMLVAKQGSNKNMSDWLITKQEYEKLYPNGFKITQKFEEVKNYWNLSRDEIVTAAEAISELDPSLVDLSEWLEWQRSIQEAGSAGHSCDSATLATLLQYADNRRFQLSPSTQCPSYSTQQLFTQVLKLDGKKKTPVKKKTKSKMFKSPGKKDGDIRALFNTATKSTKEYTKIRNDIGLNDGKHSLPNILIDLLVDLSVEKANRPTDQPCLLEGTVLECIRLKDFMKINTTKSHTTAHMKLPDINICDRITKEGLKRLTLSKSCVSPTMSDDLFFNDDCFPMEEVESQLHTQIDNRIDEINNYKEKELPKTNVAITTKHSLNCPGSVSAPEVVNVVKVDNFNFGELDDIFVDSLVETESSMPDLNQNIDLIEELSLDPIEEVNKSDRDEQKNALEFFGLDSIEDMFADNSDESEDFPKKRCPSPVNNIDKDEEPTTPSLLSGNNRRRKSFSKCSPILGSQKNRINISTKKSNDFTTDTCSTPMDVSTQSRIQSIKPTSLTKKIASTSVTCNKSLLKDDSNEFINQTNNKGESSKCLTTQESSLYTITQIMDMVNKDETINEKSLATEELDTESSELRGRVSEIVNLDYITDVFSETVAHDLDVDSDISCSPIILTQIDKIRASTSKTEKNVNKDFSKDSIVIVETSSDSDSTEEYDITDFELNDKDTKKSAKPHLVSTSQTCGRTTKRNMEIEQSKSPYFNKKPRLELKIVESSNSCVATKPKLSLRDKLKAVRDVTECNSQPNKKSDNFDTFHVMQDAHTSSRFFKETMSQKENTNPIRLKRGNDKQNSSDDSDLENFSQSIRSINKLQQFRKGNSSQTKQSQNVERINSRYCSNVGIANKKTTALKFSTTRVHSQNAIRPSQESDSDDEFIFKPKKLIRPKIQRIETTNIATNRRSPEVKKHLIRKKHKRKPKCQFIEYEAELDNSQDSGDELTQNGDLDGELEDFICDEEEGTGAADEDVDMQALYLQSVQNTNKGVFKIPKLQPDSFNVLSQAEPYNDTCYELDSFCVDTCTQLTQNHDLSELEIAEMKLKKMKKEVKRKRIEKKLSPSTSLINSPAIVKPARSVRRVINSDDSDFE